MRRRLSGPAACAALAVALAACVPWGSARADTIALAAVYPLSGSQAEGGREELWGVELAAAFINRAGGIRGRPVTVTAVDAPSADEAADAVRRAVRQSGARLVLGSYGSTIALPAAEATGALRATFWETGAVTNMLTGRRHPFRFRTVAAGSALGSTGARFAAEVLAPLLKRPAASLRVAITYADDVYGRSVAVGHRSEAAEQGMPVVLDVGYDPRRFDPDALAASLHRAAPDILLSSSYLEDGVSLRRALLRRGVPLLALVGTSSGFCLPSFGLALGEDAVGLFAADKPDGRVRPEVLTPSARALLERVQSAYQQEHQGNLSAAAMHGFVGAWVLLHEVLPRAASLEPPAVTDAALAIDLPMGTSINGAGVRFARPDAPDAGQNRRAVAVVGQWQAPQVMRVVYPALFAQAPPAFVPLPR